MATSVVQATDLEDYKAFYFTSLISLLDNHQDKPHSKIGARIPHSQRPSSKVRPTLSQNQS